MDQQFPAGAKSPKFDLLRERRQGKYPSQTLLTRRLKSRPMRRTHLEGEVEPGKVALRLALRLLRRSRPRDPLIRFGHMFEGPHAGLLVLRGWISILAGACEEIDHLVAVRRLRFNWVSLQEENGAGRFIYAVNDRAQFVVDLQGESRRAFTHVNSEVPIALARHIDAIACEAERLTVEACIVCGDRCTPETYFGHQLPLCKRHRPELVSEATEEGLEGVWRLAVERDVAPRSLWV
jgi:hypothetical protein